ncbi:MAG: phenylacetate--CoA ligase family protein, partial [Gammaproteobacteria bacterium]|nr:phenylacetate--CoA ligase family protein [Gammaproteobacteria bacterium]
MFSLKQRLMSQVIFPLYHVMKRDGLLAAIKNLEESQWETRENLIAIQNEKLAMLLAHSKKNVPYYNQLFASKGLADADL